MGNYLKLCRLDFGGDQFNSFRDILNFSTQFKCDEPENKPIASSYVNQGSKIFADKTLTLVTVLGQ